jgi:hypothetical protein
MKILVLVILLTAAIAAHPAHGAKILTYPNLAHRLYDLQRLATPPEPGEKTGSATSYDRASTYDANNDGSGYVGREGD